MCRETEPMSRVEQATRLITERGRVAVAVMLVLTVVMGAGAGMVGQSSSLDQFQGDSDASAKLDYIEENFSTGPDNQTSVQLIVRGEDVLEKQSLLSLLRLEEQFRDNETINKTLAENSSVVGVPNVIATAAIRGEQAGELQATAAEFRQLNRTVAQERTALTERRTALNGTAEQLRGALDTLRTDRSASARTQFDRVRANSSVDLNASDYGVFNRSVTQLRAGTNQSQAEQAYRLGTRGVLADEFQQVQERGTQLQEQGARLQELGRELQNQQAALENASSPTLDEQIAQVESMNESQVDRTTERVLRANASGSFSALTFMPTGYDPGSTGADATMLLVTQRTEGGTTAQGTASDRVIDAQLAMQAVADADGGPNGQEVIVFGSGLISEEIDNSMGDSLAIVGPLALLFVVVALAVAYRDLLDILLGLFGIGVVLVWTFGFMGWTDIAFNQIFIAVPVLLIGLSIDYAIHIFMRHREERNQLENGPRKSMKVALGGVGVALVWVTATTVIGFLSNLTSPVPPIKDFGVVSAVGITAALLVFGILIPALKVELDEFLEGRGWNRQKSAFGTGGGRFSDVLSVGATAAKKAPVVVILLAILLSAGAAYGGAQVDTSFNQEDFLAEDPPGWMKELPEPFKPSEYNAKQQLEYVNDNFVREDSQAQLLLQGDVANADALAAAETASEEAAASNVTTKLADGKANIRSPLSVMRQVAATNATFNATFTAADTDGDGVPDRNVDAVYDSLFAVAGDQAAGVIHRTDGGEYEALRLVVSTSGGASGADVTNAMQDIADGAASASGLEVTATGQTILFKIVQDQLLETVIQSLLITLVAVFAFLMATYRVTEGSATLGAVTLLPVVFSVSWILGTMYLLDIPFNILTGMITSLTVGLGVAYSIHLSERYNQELERTGSVWTAMNRAVTGTGGALLGSAATTVGGFGTLAFAILPPLQQFGIITGMTIIYAFLASVLVLPSLLVVWTKYMGPSDAFESEGSPGGGTSADGTTADGTTPIVNGPPATSEVVGDVSAVTEEPDTTGGAAGTPKTTTAGETDTAASTREDVAGVPARARAGTSNGQGRPYATRSVEPSRVRPGQEFTVTVSFPAVAGRVVLDETAPGTDARIDAVTPEPVQAVASEDGVYAIWDLDSETAASVTYTVTAPTEATDGGTLSLQGEALFPDHEIDVAGTEMVVVTTDVLGDVLGNGHEVSARDLADVSAHLEAGVVTDEEFERVYHAWLDEHASSMEDTRAGED
jgi:predicted RND superfamily exporter protein